MAPLLKIPVKDSQILTVVYTCTALVVTVFRLSVRRRSRWWWDDAFAVVGVIAIILQCIVLWMRIRRVPALVHNPTANISFFYLNSMCLYLEDWMARLSILWSIIRIAPSDRTKIRLKWISVLYILCMIGNGIIIVATCERNTAWHSRLPPRCSLEKSVPIYRIITGVIADAFLVYVPIRILQGLKSAPKLKTRLQIIFASSLFMTLACIVQSIVTITLPGDPELVASLTEGFVALVTCNLTIVVTALFRLAGARNGLEADIGRTGFTKTPSAILFRTFTMPSAHTKPTTPIATGSMVAPDSGSTPTGLTSMFTEDDQRSQKSEEENARADSEVIDISNSRPSQSFFERWRSLDVDDEV